MYICGIKLSSKSAETESKKILFIHIDPMTSIIGTVKRYEYENLFPTKSTDMWYSTPDNFPLHRTLRSRLPQFKFIGPINKVKWNVCTHWEYFMIYIPSSIVILSASFCYWQFQMKVDSPKLKAYSSLQ